MKSAFYNNKLVIILAVSVPLFIIGLILTVFISSEMSNNLIAERDQHLYHLASSADHSINSVFERTRKQLENTISHIQDDGVESLYLESGDTEAISDLLSKSDLLMTIFAAKIIVSDSDRVFYSTDPDDTLYYSVYPHTFSDDIFIYQNEAEQVNYIGLSQDSPESGYTYTVLMDITAFFRRIVSSSIYDNYRVIIYDEESGLVIHNSADIPEYAFLTPIEIEERSDDLTMLDSFVRGHKQGAASFTYSTSGNASMNAQISCLPSEFSENGSFSIGVSMDDTSIVKPAKTLFVRLLIAAFLIAFSLSSAVFFIVHSEKRMREMEKELDALEKHNELTANLLAQQGALAHHQKLETIGTLTSGIAHEFNNLLSPIMSNSLLIIESMPSDEGSVYESAVEIYNSSQKAKNITSQLGKLSRRHSSDSMRPIRPADIIESVLTVVSSVIPANTEVTKNYMTERRFLGDESELSHLFLNIIINAIHAMEPDGGELNISIFDNEDYVTFAITDTGPGIPEQDLDKLFDPFFTTKEAGKGTGLGLAISQRIAGNHGTHITAENIPGKGACFAVSFKVIVTVETE